jgi:hypothetical protein
MDIPNFNTALVERHKIIDILLDQIARAGFCFVQSIFDMVEVRPFIVDKHPICVTEINVIPGHARVRERVSE